MKAFNPMARSITPVFDNLSIKPSETSHLEPKSLEGVVNSSTFNSILKNQKDKVMDYVVVYMSNRDPNEFYVCDENGVYCDTNITIPEIKEMIEEDGTIIEYDDDFNKKYVMNNRHKKLTVKKVVEEGIIPFDGCMITIIKNKK